MLSEECKTKRTTAKCGCCNKRLKKVVTYECWTEDCDDHVLHGNVAKEDRWNSECGLEGEE